MVQILEPVPSFGQQLARGLGAGISGGLEKGFEHALDINKIRAQELAKKKEDKQQTFQNLQSTIGQMRALVGGSGIGALGFLNPSDEASHNRAMMRTLGSEMLNYYKALFPRGITQQEFIRFEKDYLPKPGERTATTLGKLDAFEDLIAQKMGSEWGKSSSLPDMLEEETNREGFFNKQNLKQTASAHKASKAKKVPMIAPNGKKVPMSEENVEEALERGWKRL